MDEKRTPLDRARHAVAVALAGLAAAEMREANCAPGSPERVAAARAQAGWAERLQRARAALEQELPDDERRALVLARDETLELQAEARQAGKVYREALAVYEEARRRAEEASEEEHQLRVRVGLEVEP